METIETHSQTRKRLNSSAIDLKALYSMLFVIIDEVGEKKLNNLGVLSTSTIWRWKKEINKKAPSVDSVLSLLEYHSGNSSITAIANRYDSIIKEFLSLAMPGMFNPSENRIIDKNEAFLKDEIDYQIYYMCSNKRGSTLDEIIYTVGLITAKKMNIAQESRTNELIISSGQVAKIKLQALLDNNVLFEDKGYFKCPDENTYIQGDNALKNSIQVFANNINPETWQTGINVFYLSSESVEPEVAKAASKVLTTAYMKASKMLIESKSSSPSAVPFAICVGGERLISHKQEEQL
jgi:hypothetical protein